MIEIRPVQMSDAAFWRRLDPHISAEKFERKAVRDGRGHVLLETACPRRSCAIICSGTICPSARCSMSMNAAADGAMAARSCGAGRQT